MNMSKQKLIDLNEFQARCVDPDECLAGRMYACGWNGVIHLLEKTPVIDPEDLPIVKELRSELKSYKDLGVTPEQIALLIKFFKERTSAEYITSDMNLITGALRYEQLNEQLLLTQQKLQEAADSINGICKTYERVFHD